MYSLKQKKTPGHRKNTEVI